MVELVFPKEELSLELLMVTPKKWKSKKHYCESCHTLRHSTFMVGNTFLAFGKDRRFPNFYKSGKPYAYDDWDSYPLKDLTDKAIPSKYSSHVIEGRIYGEYESWESFEGSAAFEDFAMQVYCSYSFYRNIFDRSEKAPFDTNQCELKLQK